MTPPLFACTFLRPFHDTIGQAGRIHPLPCLFYLLAPYCPLHQAPEKLQKSGARPTGTRDAPSSQTCSRRLFGRRRKHHAVFGPLPPRPASASLVFATDLDLA